MRWQEPKTEPGMMDVLGYLVALDTLHGSTSWLDLSSAGTSHGTAWRVTVVSVFPVASGARGPRKLVTSVTFPNVDSSTMGGCMLKLLVDHDYRISREVYAQGELPLA